MRKLNKKGISPLIATVLIIGFVIAIAMIIFAFVRDNIKEQAEKTEMETEGAPKCVAVQVSVVKCENNVVTIKNNGKQIVSGFTFRTKLGSEMKSEPIQMELSPGSEEEFEVNSCEGDALPLVEATGRAYPCSDKILTITGN